MTNTKPRPLDLVDPAYFYYIAHILLHSGNVEMCLKVIEDGLTKHGSKRLKSEMLELQAIAFAAMNRPPELVRQTFKEAELADERTQLVSTIPGYAGNHECSNLE